MEIRLAKTAGFCFGVNRAVELTYNLLNEGHKVATLGPLIHNPQAVADMERRGALVADTVDDIPTGYEVIIRSHGVPRTIYDTLEQRGLVYHDATCPFVKKIQSIAARAEAEGAVLLVAGDAAHPEVQGIASWCRDARIFGNAEEVEKWAEETAEIADLPITMVAQTTCIRALWESCVKFLKKECTNLKIDDTICNATQKRQSEAAEIASSADVMVVVGDRKSANTRHLTEICKENCTRVYQIEDADELSPDMFHGCTVAGLTAGASTPAGIIKEVYATMTEEIKTIEGNETFEEMLDKSFKTLNTGDKVTGIVTAIGTTEIQVDLGCKQAGYIPVSELSSDPDAKVEDIVHVGDEIETYIVRVNDVEGYATLSKKRLDAVKVWEDIENAVENKTVLEGIVTEENKGGIVVSVKGVRVFVPASQSGLPKDSDLSQLIKQRVQLRVTEVNRARRRVVGSIRSVASEQRKAAQEKIWSEIEVGKQYHGTVKSLTSYGAFVDIGGVDGMVHVSELSWNRIKNPAEVVKVGDEIDVYVIALDPEKKKISLGYKTEATNPWTIFNNEYKVGDVVTVKIVKLMTFGAFAEIIPGVDGLTGLGHLAVDEDAACIRHLVCHGAAFDEAGDLEILIQTHLELFLSFQQKSRRTLCRQRRRDRTDYRVSFRDLPGLNTMLREAAMVMGSRVRGLMP